MHRTLIAAAALLVIIGSLVPAGRADTTLGWTGTVAYINNAHIGVKGQSQGKTETKDFLLTEDLKGVYSSDGKKIDLGAVKVGQLVRVSYERSAVFGSTRATRIDEIRFGNLPLPISSPT
jgi:hypothetical protein